MTGKSASGVWFSRLMSGVFVFSYRAIFFFSGRKKRSQAVPARRFRRS